MARSCSKSRAASSKGGGAASFSPISRIICFVLANAASRSGAPTASLSEGPAGESDDATSSPATKTSDTGAAANASSSSSSQLPVRAGPSRAPRFVSSMSSRSTAARERKPTPAVDKGCINSLMPTTATSLTTGAKRVAEAGSATS